jgi:hypothetical protein
MVQKNEEAAQLRAKADKYRMLARWVTDRETAQRIAELTAELEQRASILEKPSQDRIRERAHEIWEESHRPAGRDDEFWHRAERELQANQRGEYPQKRYG